MNINNRRRQIRVAFPDLTPSSDRQQNELNSALNHLQQRLGKPNACPSAKEHRFMRHVFLPVDQDASIRRSSSLIQEWCPCWWACGKGEGTESRVERAKKAGCGFEEGGEAHDAVSSSSPKATVASKAVTPQPPGKNAVERGRRRLSLSYRAGSTHISNVGELSSSRAMV